MRMLLVSRCGPPRNTGPRKIYMSQRTIWPENNLAPETAQKHWHNCLVHSFFMFTPYALRGSLVQVFDD